MWLSQLNNIMHCTDQENEALLNVTNIWVLN